LAHTFIFADEAGCFTFKRQVGASIYFILCSVCMDECSITGPLLNLRRRLIASGEQDRDKLHATTDSYGVREEVYSILSAGDFTIDATILEKPKAHPRIREDHPTFYRYAWFYHFKHVGPKRCLADRRTLITAAALGNRKSKARFKEAVNNVAQQLIPRDRWEVSFLESSQEPGLWVADYCAWAIQRKWERGDDEAYKRIQNKIATEFDLWRSGNVLYY
jgi:hypothetical protein